MRLPFEQTFLRRMRSTLLLKGQDTQTLTGFSTSVFLGVIGLIAIICIPENAAVATTALLIIPLIASFYLTRNFLASLSLVWLNELLFGGSGRWLEIGQISGRWVIFSIMFVAIILQFCFKNVKDPKRVLTRVRLPDLLIVFFGILFPSALVAYSVLLKGTSLIWAFKDVTTYLTLVVYFPIRQLVLEKFDFFSGWILGGISVVAAFSIMMCLAPPEVMQEIFMNLTMGAVELGAAEGPFQRAPAVTMLVLFIGVFLGALRAVDVSKPPSKRFAGLLLMLFSFCPIALNYLRGFMMALLGVCAIFFVSTVWSRKFRTMGAKVVCLAVLLLAVAGLSIYLYIPEGVIKFSMEERTARSWVMDYAREEQYYKMMEAWQEEPFLGKGVGVPIRGYSRLARLEHSLTFELSYMAILYRLGMLAFLVFLAPVLWFFLTPFQIYRSYLPTQLSQREGEFMIAALFSLLATLLAGVFNPYVYTPFPPLFIALYLSCRELTRRTRKQRELTRSCSLP